jgi:hypothetical protein
MKGGTRVIKETIIFVLAKEKTSGTMKQNHDHLGYGRFEE